MKAKFSLILNEEPVEWTGPEEDFNDQTVDDLFRIFNGLIVAHGYSLTSLMAVVKEWINNNPELEREANKLFKI